MTAYSVLDLSPITEGGTPSEALANSRDLARHAESLGYTRYWVAEHHNMPGIASAATAVVIGHIAGGTNHIRVGSGGIMLPNHSPLVIAEQFGTLAALYPDRIDLGLGRAPGTDMGTARALRRDLEASAHAFPQDVQELQAYLGPRDPSRHLNPVPCSGSNVPIWLLGSSLFSAQLAAALGLPFAFASHFAPDMLFDALQVYRDRFQPSAQLEKPYAMAGVMASAAETDEEARYHFTSAQQNFVYLRRGNPGQVPKPVEDMDAIWHPREKAGVEHTFRYALIGSPATVKAKAERFVADTGIDELMVSAPIFDFEMRKTTLSIVADAMGERHREAAE
ncbi:LLM class flavin-dependent oxidoreductase [Pararhizobium mangrovi]|uniref:Luciferase-like monooxygenase n=1 Tax=Pararhizobium mangrovi TaxID=2590452 RepID=A0A506UHB5_9HYPH|nr:LLM class flavin-dependent oxidoreductase [Pararhizobium mangrovi]TPW32688.1 LLM class flavin-dependent oxidoreductase [Pararhizobium mangrovi]